MTITVPPLHSEPDYRAANLLHQKIVDDKNRTHVEALRSKAKEHLAVDHPDQAAKIAKIATTGEFVDEEDQEDNKAICKRLTRRYWDLKDAEDISAGRLRKANYEASKRICDKLKPEHDKIIKRLLAGFAEAHQASVELYKLKNDMMAQDVKFLGICGLTPHTILGSPNDKQSPLAYLFNEAKALGLISSVPSEFRI